jgi:hypothetical protein
MCPFFLRATIPPPMESIAMPATLRDAIDAATFFVDGRHYQLRFVSAAVEPFQDPQDDTAAVRSPQPRKRTAPSSQPRCE